MDQEHPPPVAKELARLSELDARARIDHIRSHGEELKAETLVHLLRVGAGSCDTSLFESCGRLLLGEEGEGGWWNGGHCERIIMSLARRYRFTRDPDLLREYRSRCHAEMWKAVYRGREEKPFWEIRFGYCMKHVCIQEARSLVRRLNRERDRETLLPDPEEGPALDVSVQESSPEDDILGRISKRELLTAIRRLPERQAQAALLAWVENRPIALETADSVASVMGISESRVHQLLRKARARLQQDPVVRAQRDET